MASINFFRGGKNGAVCAKPKISRPGPRKRLRKKVAAIALAAVLALSPVSYMGGKLAGSIRLPSSKSGAVLSSEKHLKWAWGKGYEVEISYPPGTFGHELAIHFQEKIARELARAKTEHSGKVFQVDAETARKINFYRFRHSNAKEFEERWQELFWEEAGKLFRAFEGKNISRVEITDFLRQNPAVNVLLVNNAAPRFLEEAENAKK